MDETLIKTIVNMVACLVFIIFFSLSIVAFKNNWMEIQTNKTRLTIYSVLVFLVLAIDWFGRPFLVRIFSPFFK